MTEQQLSDADADEEIKRKVAQILRLADQIVSLPIIPEGTPEELIGYDEFGAPSRALADRRWRRRAALSTLRP